MAFLRGAMVVSLDLIESLGVGACLFAAFFISWILRLTVVSRIFITAKYLLPRGLMTTYMRSKLDLAFSKFDHAACSLNHILHAIEKSEDWEDSESLRRFMTILYSELVLVNLRAGYVDAAAAGVIRANTHIGIKSLPHLPDFDARTAHIVKAGIAASRLLSDKGFATLMVKQDQSSLVDDQLSDPSRISREQNSGKGRQGRNKSQGVDDPNKSNVIPFPMSPRP